MSDHVDDSALDAAAEVVATEEEAVEETHEEVIEDVVETEEEVKAKGEHKESSRLGRRLSAIEERMDVFLSQAEKLVTPKDEAIEEIDPDMPVTLKEVEAYLGRKEETRRNGRVNYESAYVRSVAGLAEGEDSDFANRIMDEMESNYNAEYSKDGGRDAEINWLKASNAVLKKGTQKKNPLTGPKTKAPLGVGGADTNTERGYTRPKLDAATEDLIARSNFSDEQLERALTSNKIYSAGERNAKNV